MQYHRFGEIDRVAMGSAAFKETLRAVSWHDDGHWYLGGDRHILVLSADGEPIRDWSTGKPPWSLAVDSEGRVWVGEPGQVEVFSPEGKPEDTWRNDELFGLVTAMAVTADSVFVADAGTRWIHRFDRGRQLLNHIGDQHRKGGFHIPNGVVDFGIDLDGTVVVANPGMHRVERYQPGGESLGYFGRFGQHDPAGFPGCCNPTNIALGPGGEVVVSEKAGPRVKVYAPDGALRSVVSGEEDFDPSCKNMDLAVDHQGRIGVVDPVGLALVFYEPTGVAT